MKASLLNIYKIEMIKLVKKKDIVSILIIVLLPLLFAISIMLNQYVGPEKQSALFWAGTQLSNASILYFTPVVFAVIAARIMAAEIQNKNFLLYIPRVRNRGTIYLAKTLAVITFALIIFIIVTVFNLLIYYVAVIRNPIYGTGEIFGTNGLDLIKFMIMIFFSSFILISNLTLFLSTKFKMMPTIGIVLLITSIFHFAWKVPYFSYINPWHYVVMMANAVGSFPDITKDLGVSINELLLSGILLCSILSIVFSVLGYRKFKEIDL